MNRDDMRNRTKKFALRVIRLSAALPIGREADVLGRQVLKSATSIGANYREAQRASSRRHFTTILETALREADETDYWLELLSEADLVKPTRLRPLMAECKELIKILSATVRTTKKTAPRESTRQAKSQIPNPKS